MALNHSKVIKDPVLGNGLAANRDLAAGEPIVKISEPFLLVVEHDALEKVCSYCLTESSTLSLKRCTGCKVVRYCTTTCQKTDWNLIHKNECSLLRKLPGIPPTPVRALYQAILRHMRPSFELDSRSAALEHHSGDLRKDMKRWEEIVQQAKGALEFAKAPADKLITVTMLLCIMTTNAFRATLPDDTPIGLCYEPTLALANHSCKPNAFIVFDGRCISLMALDPIKSNEQIFISYIDPTQARDVRKAELRQRYFFECNCEKCMHDYNPYQTFQKTAVIPSEKQGLLYDYKTLSAEAGARDNTIRSVQQELPSLKENISKANSLIHLSKTTASESERFKSLKQAYTELTLFKSHGLYALPPYPTILEESYKSFIDASLFSSALLLRIFIFLNCDIYNWPQPDHPVRVIRLFTIYRLLKRAASLEPTVLAGSLDFVPKKVLEEIDFIDAAHAVLILVRELVPQSHGRDSGFMRTVEEDLREVEDVQRSRGGVGGVLKEWQSVGDAEKDGRRVAAHIFKTLRILARYAWDVIGNKLDI